MIERYYTIAEIASMLRIHPEYARALLARLPGISPPAYRRFGSHPRRVRVVPERDVLLLQKALIRFRPQISPVKGSKSNANANSNAHPTPTTNPQQGAKPKEAKRRSSL
jgi:hypothetical protein